MEILLFLLLLVGVGVWTKWQNTKHIRQMHREYLRKYPPKKPWAVVKVEPMNWVDGECPSCGWTGVPPCQRCGDDCVDYGELVKDGYYEGR